MRAPRRTTSLLLVGALSLGLACPVLAEPLDPLLPLILRMNGFLHRGETDGVTRDPRNLRNPPEEIRLSVIPQLLGYCELAHVFPSEITYQDIRDRADFLLVHLHEATSGSAFDGMLALSMLDAHALTGDPRYRAAAEPFLSRFRAMRSGEVRLNWGLMAAMALAEDFRATGNEASLNQVRSILAGVAREQNFDGSFPHYCVGTRDIHYSAWMAMEMILIGGRIGDANLDRVLTSLNGFLQGRVDLAGLTRYEDPGPFGGRAVYYSQGGGCPDYDTRGWINELGYSARIFDRFRDSRYHGVMERLRQLEDHGAFADKYGFFPESWDPIYPWATENHSVIRTSVIFWSLTSLYADRTSRRPARYADPSTHVATTPAPDEEEATEGTIEGKGSSEVLATSPIPADEDLGPYVAREAPAVLPEASTDEVISTHPTPNLAMSSEHSGGGSSDLGVEGTGGAPGVTEMGFGPVTPNPAPGSCAAALRLPRSEVVRLEIFDATGRRVRAMAPVSLSAGTSVLRWDGRDESGAPVKAGLYLMRAGAGQHHALARVAITR